MYPDTPRYVVLEPIPTRPSYLVIDTLDASKDTNIVYSVSSDVHNAKLQADTICVDFNNKAGK